MDDAEGEYRITWWKSEFSDPAMERSFQKHMRAGSNRLLRLALLFWGVVILLFTVPDFLALGLTRPFYYLAAYRVIMAAALGLLASTITAESDFTRLDNLLTPAVFAGVSGFILLFAYHVEAVEWVMMVMMFQILGLFVLLPARFLLSVITAFYGVLITLVSRWLMGAPLNDLVSLAFLLLLALTLGAAIAIRLGISQRSQFVFFLQAEKTNQELAGEIGARLQLEAALREMAATDPLTGLCNRREYGLLAEREMERARRFGTPLSLAIIDLDYFKRVNDSYGHAAGDEVLRQIGALCRQQFRAVDVLGRLGGEEFIILLPETPMGQAAIACERLLKVLAETDMNLGAVTVRVTATIGLAELLPDDADIQSLTRRADDALYRGKARGRNCVEVSEPVGA